MVIIGVLFGLFCLVTFFMPWVNRSRISGLDQEISEIRRDIRTLQTVVGAMAYKQPGEETAPKPEHAKAARQPTPIIRETLKAETPVHTPINLPPRGQPSVPVYPAKAVFDEKEPIQLPSNNSFELNLGTKLPVWIGAVSLICAAFFLVKYSIEAGLLGPMARVSMGILFGSSLVAAGQWIVKRFDIANSERIAQGLVGAGLVSLYFSLYAAVSQYHFLPPLFGFGAMTVVTALAVIMSLRHGQPIAIFGMIGGLLTPALVGSHEPNPMALFSYLFLLFTGMLYIMARKGWWILASAALAGIFLWTAFWFSTAFTAIDSVVLVLFPVAICASVLTATRSYVLEDRQAGAHAHGLNLLALAGGALTILWLSFRMTLTPFDWSMLGLITIGCMGLTYFRPAIYMNALLGKLGIDLLLFAIWTNKASMPDVMCVTAGIAALYVLAPYFLMRRVQDPRLWAGLQFFASIALYGICYYRIPLSPQLRDHGFWGIISIVLAVLSTWQAGAMRLAYKADNIVQDHLVSIYALATTSFISLGLAIELPLSYLPIAFAAQAMATMWIYDKTGIEVLKKIAFVLTCLFIALNYQQIALFANVILASINHTAPSSYFVNKAMSDTPLLHMGLPAVFLGIALLMNKSRRHSHDPLSHILFGTTLVLVTGALYYLIRNLFHAGPGSFAILAGFMERGTISLVLAAIAIGILQYAERFDTDFIKIWSIGLFNLVLIRIGYFDLFLHNPYQDATQLVGHWPLLNGITFVYGMGTALCLYALRNNILCFGFAALQSCYKVLGLVFLLALSSLTVRQYFHPNVLQSYEHMGHTEFYSYSVAWLLMGLSLLTIGLVWSSKACRVASLAFLLLTIGKVFLFDASELEGLFRVFSFLGLGLSLIGLSYFYSRFIGRSDQGQKS